MGQLLGITGAINSGKSTVAQYLANMQPNHAVYETWFVVAEIANAFNQALKAELEFATTNNPVELANQVLIWLPEAISEQLHHDVVWNQLAFNRHDTLAHPELFEKLFKYLKAVEKDHKIIEAELTPDNKATYRSLLQWLGSYLVAKLSKTIWYDELLRRVELYDSRADLVIISGVRYPSDAEVVRAKGGLIVGVTRPGTDKNDDDPTEIQRGSIKPDVVVHNNGSLADLQAIIETMWNDLAAGQPQQAYSAK